MFYGDLVYKFKRIVGTPYFSDLFKTIIKRFKKDGYNFMLCDGFKPYHSL